MRRGRKSQKSQSGSGRRKEIATGTERGTGETIEIETVIAIEIEIETVIETETATEIVIAIETVTAIEIATGAGGAMTPMIMITGGVIGIREGRTMMIGGADGGSEKVKPDSRS